MSFDLQLFAKKLKACREELLLSDDDVAKATGLPIQRLAQLEAGQAEPTGDEILIFADYYKQNFNFFISNQQKTATEQVKILYRKFNDEFTKEDRWAVREFVYLCECEAYIFEAIGFDKINFQYSPQGINHKSHGIAGASALRLHLGLKPDSLMPDPYQTLRKLGIHIFRRKLTNSKISGLFIDHPLAGRCVLVNYDEDIFRQHFTLAHEVGHAIFDFGERINVSFGVTGEDKYKEIRANNFASNLLIPKPIFQQLGAQNWNDKQVIDVAKQLQVNIQPLTIAMKEAGAISESKYNELQHLKIPKSDKVDPELKGLSEGYLKAKKTLLERGLSTFYVKLAYDCYAKGHISAGRLADMLLCDETEMVQILKLFDLELSYGH